MDKRITPTCLIQPFPNSVRFTDLLDCEYASLVLGIDNREIVDFHRATCNFICGQYGFMPLTEIVHANATATSFELRGRCINQIGFGTDYKGS